MLAGRAHLRSLLLLSLLGLSQFSPCHTACLCSSLAMMALAKCVHMTRNIKGSGHPCLAAAYSRLLRSRRPP